MINKRYHYVVNLVIASNFHIILDPVYPPPCVRGSIMVGELREIWVLLSPQILEPIIHEEF